MQKPFPKTAGKSFQPHRLIDECVASRTLSVGRLVVSNASQLLLAATHLAAAGLLRFCCRLLHIFLHRLAKVDVTPSVIIGRAVTHLS